LPTRSRSGKAYGRAAASYGERVKPPIFVRADEPLLIYRTADDAARYLEWIDIEDGIYTAFDSEGRLLRFELIERPTKMLRFIPITVEYVALRDAEAEPTHQEQLRETLVAGLTARGESMESLATLSLEELEGLALQRIGFDWPNS
jgi:hypothetical protein